jgi:hypothetical protein
MMMDGAGLNYIKQCLTEGSGDDFVSVGIVEGDGVDYVAVALQRQQLVPGYRVPHLARAVVTAGDELVARLVEGAVRQRQNMRPQNFKQKKVASLVAFQLLYQFYY